MDAIDNEPLREPPQPRPGRRLRRCASIEDVGSAARRSLPGPCFDWLDGGAGAEVTLRANRAAFERVSFRPRVLVDVAERELATVACGTRLAFPAVLAPIGLAGIVRPGAEPAVARAAGRAGIAYCVSAGASTPIEEVARAATGPLWFQLYLWRGSDVQERLLARAERCGCETLVLTVDTPVGARRERDIRNDFRVPLSFTLRQHLANAVRYPGWSWRALRGPDVSFGNLEETRGGALAQVMSRLHDASTTFDHVRRLRERWPGRLVVKGILAPEDAVEAVECGADAVVVSNHGGRQLDGAPATLDALAAVAAAVGVRGEVLVDGGVRRGADIAKALALGARAVLVGRPYLYGLAAGGEAGVDHVLDLLRRELDVTLALLGRPSVADLDPSAVRVG
ncbi:MAG: alpha-hydroxy acid oxidase [Actinomycetota bacterium]